MRKRMIFLNLFLIGFFVVVLASCTHNKDIEVIDFSTDKTSYEIGEEIKFNLKIDNPNSYNVESVVINDESYTVDETISTVDYKISPNIKFEEGKTRFILSKIVYEKEGEVKEIEVNKLALANKKLIAEKDVVVTSFDIKSLTNSESDKFYQNDLLEAEITLQKKNNIKILKFGFEIVKDGENAPANTISVGYLDNGLSNTYKVEFQMPSVEGSAEIRLKQIDYTYNSYKKKIATPTKINCEVEAQKVEVLDVKVSRQSGFGQDVNKQKYVDSTSVITMTITLENNSNVEFEGLVISGQMFGLSKNEILENPAFSRVTITKKISLQALTGFPDKLTLDKIVYKTPDNDKEMNLGYVLAENIYFYDKIIKASSDFENLKTENGKIVGNYILGKDIKLNASNKLKLFNDYVFAGKLEGNGFELTIDSTVASLFKEVAKEGEIQNLKLNLSSTNKAFLCNINNGSLNNVQVNGTLNVKNDSEGIILCENNTGSITNVEFLTNIVTNRSTIHLVKQNSGIISQVIVDQQQFPFNRNILVPLPEENSGTVSNIVLSLNHWYDGANVDDVRIQNTLLLIKTKGGTYQNIILNKEFRNRADEFNKVIKGPDFGGGLIGGILDFVGEVYENIRDKLEMLDYFSYDFVVNEQAKGEEVATIIERSVFTETYYSQLGFRGYSESNNCFWRVSGNKATLDFN